jgi:hypothetical protein
VRGGVGDDEVGGTKGSSVERDKRPRGQAAGAIPTTVGDERVGQRDERVEHDRPPVGGTARGRQIGVARIADDQRVERLSRPLQEPQLGSREACGGERPGTPLVLVSLPDSNVPLGDLDARTPQAGDHLCVPRIPAFVGPEIQDLQERTSSTKASARSRSETRSSWWLVISSVIRPSEKTWMPTTTSSTPRIRSGRPPIAWPIALTTVR